MRAVERRHLILLECRSPLTFGWTLKEKYNANIARLVCLGVVVGRVRGSSTAIFAKVGVEGVDSDFATLIRTCVILPVLAAFVMAAGKLQDPRSLSGKCVGFLVLSAALATGVRRGSAITEPLRTGRAE